MGCCLFAIIGTLWPRLALIGIWLFAPHIPATAFQTIRWPLLGFFFLPTTTFAYELIKYNWGSIDSPGGLIFMALAFLYDIGHLGGFRRRKRTIIGQRDRFVDPG